jgi:Zn finger protein HypA/HybF involved in hydrogenase expression
MANMGAKMIHKGDGSFEQKIQDGRCPNCESVLYVLENRLDCRVCGLSIINVYKDGDNVLTSKVNQRKD